MTRRHATRRNEGTRYSPPAVIESIGRQILPQFDARRMHIMCVYCFIGDRGGSFSAPGEREPLVSRVFGPNSREFKSGDGGTAFTPCAQCGKDTVLEAILANANNAFLALQQALEEAQWLDGDTRRVKDLSVVVRDHGGGASVIVQLKNGAVVSVAPNTWMSSSDIVNIRAFAPGDLDAGRPGRGWDQGDWITTDVEGGGYSAFNTIDDVMTVIALMAAE